MPQSHKLSKVEAGVDALHLLQKQHQEVAEIFAALEISNPRSLKKRLDLVRQLVIALEAHAWIEEKILYPAGQEVDRGLTLEAYEEHSLIQFMLDRIVETEADEAMFLPRVKVLQGIVARHVREEENEYLIELQKKLGKRRYVDIGIEIHDEFASRRKRLSVVH